MVVVKTVLFVPEAGAAEGVDGIDDGDKVFEEFGGNVFVGGIVGGEFERDGEHGGAVEGHPGGAIGLFEAASIAAGEGLGAVEHANVVEAEEAAGEEVAAGDVFAIDPPGEVEHEFVKGALEEGDVALAFGGGHFVDAPDGPGVDGGVDIGEGKFVGGDLAVGVHVPFAEEKFELVFGEGAVDFGQGDHVKGQVPGGEPGIFPLVGHGDDIARVEVGPVGVARVGVAVGWGNLAGVALAPVVDDVVIKLLGPEEAGVGLAGDVARFGGVAGEAVFVEGVGLGEASGEGGVAVDEGGGEDEGIVGEAEADGGAAAGGDVEAVEEGCFGAILFGVSGGGVALDEGAVEGVFGEGGFIGMLIECLEVGVIFGEEEFGRSGGGFFGGGWAGGFGGEVHGAEGGVLGFDDAGTALEEGGAAGGFFVFGAPGPGVAEPKGGQEGDGCGGGTAIVDGDADENVVGVGFGVFRENVEVAGVVKDAGVGEFEFRVGAGAAAVFFDQAGVGEFGLRVFVEGLHVGVGGGAIEVVVIFFDIFAVVAFVAGEAEEAFLEDGVLVIPEGEGEAEAAFAVGNAQEAVFAPAVGAGAGVIVGEVTPAIAVGGIIFADGGPLALGEVGAPAFPVVLAEGVLVEAEVFESGCGHGGGSEVKGIVGDVGWRGKERGRERGRRWVVTEFFWAYALT